MARELELRAAAELKVGNTVQLRVIGKDGEREKELSQEVVWESSNHEVVTIDANGLATVIAGGPVEIKARVGELEATLSSRATCDYPRFSPQLQFGRVVPPLSWPAKWPDGTDFEFSLENVYCDYDWKDVKTFTFVLSAGWCPPCTLYAQRLEGEVAALREKGMQVAIIEVEDTAYMPADLEFAYRHLGRITNNIPGIVAGDADTRPQAEFLASSEILTAFPTVFVVRTSDMRIIADQNRFNTYLPLEAIAAEPDADWSNAPRFVNNCGPDDEEEVGAPNDTYQQATLLTPGTHTGGICTAHPDFYRIDATGPWTVTLEFRHAVGDLDLFLWDTDLDQPAERNGTVVGSYGPTDREVFSHSGPAVIAVMGYSGASAPYTITLTAEN